MARVKWAVLAVLAFAAAGASAQPLLSAEEASARVAEAYGVEVLRARPEIVDGRATYLLSVMRPAETRNGAMGVHQLRVDAETGALIPAFRHRTSGYDLPGAPQHRPNRQAPDAARDGAPWR